MIYSRSIGPFVANGGPVIRFRTLPASSKARRVVCLQTRDLVETGGLLLSDQSDPKRLLDEPVGLRLADGLAARRVPRDRRWILSIRKFGKLGKLGKLGKF